MNVKIITDSACDMPSALFDEYDVQVIPLYILNEGKSYQDGIDIQADQLYDDMRKGVHYTTSQIPYTDFVTVFTKYAQAGQPFLELSFSSGLSGTFQTASLALRDVKEKYPDVPMAVVDTKAVTGGLGLMVGKIAKAAQKGADLEALIKYTNALSAHICHTFTVTNLEYLYRGGRLNKGTAMVGNMLNICPLLEVDQNGELNNVDKARGEKKLIKKMVESVEKRMADPEKQTMYIANIDNMPLVEGFIKTMHKRFMPKTIEIMTMAPIIGTHCGPGTLAVFYYDALVDEII